MDRAERRTPHSDAAVYAISVAAELTGVTPQTLRVYESRGLLEPARTSGGTRRYSGADLDRVDQISSMLGDGLNLAGVAEVMALRTETERLRRRISRLEAQLDRRR